MKKRINNYIFNALSKKITLTGITVQLDSLLLITNLTDNIIIFNFADETKKATVSGSEITLQYDTTAMSDTDELQIFYDDAESYPLTNTELRATPLPVSGSVTTNALTNAQLRDSAVTIQGSVTTSNGLTDSQLRAAPLSVSGTLTSNGLTNTELRATPVPVSGTVTTSGLTDTQLRATPVIVSGTVVTGGLTDSELRASDIKISLDGETVAVTGTFYPPTQPVSGPLTNTELRAVAVPISGSVTTGGLTDTQLRASDVKVSLDNEIINTSDANLLGQVQTLNTNDISFMLRYLVSIMSDPVYLNKTLNGLNAVLLSGSTTAVTGTLTGVTTVTTVSNLSSIGNKAADMTVDNISQIAWKGLRDIMV